MDTTLQDPLVGQLLDGRYRVDARIAAGGMATVYRAVDVRLDRVLALKVMHPTLAVDAAFVERFIREAKSVARLAHPNVVGVFDQGADGHYVYLAMEYVAGCTLRDVLRERGALQPRAALDILEPVLAALGAAHIAGLVHRDMKPENVLIGDDGRVKVADFGLVRAVDHNTTATTGSVLGTVSYLAPEQIEDGQAGTPADVYACGVVLYEMLTGTKPHTGTSPAQVLYQHLNEDVPPPSQAVPGLAPELDGLVAAATARDAGARPADAAALLALVRAARERLDDAALDAVPPGALPAAGAAGAEDRTSVIPRSVALRQARSADEEQLNRTSVLERAPEAGAPSGAAHRPARRVRRPLVIGALVVVLLAALTGVWYVSVGQFTHVPPVLDMTRTKASDTLHQAGLEVKVRHDYSSTVDRGHVISTSPGNGDRIRDHGTVTVVLSDGPHILTVPHLAGTPLADAKKKLSGMGLVAGKVTQDFDEDVPKGRVVSTDPAAGTKRQPDSVVNLKVSRGAEVKAPDVTGEDQDEATDDLEEAGLHVRIAARRVHAQQEKGSVAQQSPGPGESLGKGDTVTLTLSAGPEMVKVPDVTGDKVDDARRKLTDAGFEVSVRKPFFFPKDTVASQSVEGGRRAAKGSRIVIKLDGGL
ncbi:Stk1 family PASTA domain-containing Ser/Thr kinase [Streptomyces sp. NPDC059740]|uniref:Stk1 family PASTA domain-containing Ser/Thr kinase n=1 Tax=Streptomyces sp. NPDC059740 TaxID=3346926 RepID=UPI00364E6067